MVSTFEHKCWCTCHHDTDEREGTSVRRRGRPRKQRNIQGKRLFDGQSSSEEESISGSDQEDAEDEDDKQDEDERIPLNSLRPSSSKLRSLKISREEAKGQTRTGDSKASGMVSFSFFLE